jgi:hypothetical protein
MFKILASLYIYSGTSTSIELTDLHLKQLSGPLKEVLSGDRPSLPHPYCHDRVVARFRRRFSGEPSGLQATALGRLAAAGPARASGFGRRWDGRGVPALTFHPVSS